MFLASYYMDCALHEMKGKPYNKTKLLVNHLLKMWLFIIAFMALLITMMKP